ncbi:cilia- and flagella-associated protein 43 isoform X4 [Hydra vulgaris]|uniref:Cilia- and flagella-associated protein 43 n=1 Tax=Hydra vulgaris TaxID=6087 RepID=A0ABM4BKV4_HYDVU
MDQFGNLALNWSVGYNGSPIYFIDQNIICYLSLNSLKFHDITNDLVWYLESPGDGIQTLAINPEYGYVAFSEDGLDASIFVYKITSLESPVSTFKNSIGLGFSSLSFANNARIIASCTNIPKIRLSLWDFIIGKELCFIELQSPLYSLIFNPTNWKQLSGLNKDGFYLWNIDQVNESFYIEYQNIKFPDINENDLKPCKKLSFQYSNQCLKKENQQNQWHPVSQCWTTNHLVYIGCSENSIICVETISGNTFVLYISNSDISDLFECIQFYRDCLVVGGKDGVIRCFKIAKENLFPIFEKKINGSVGSLQINKSLTTLVIGSNLGIIYLMNTEKAILNELVDEYSGKIIGIHCLSKSHFVTCRENGFVQVWTMDLARCVGHLHLSCEITCFAVTASSCTVFLGTSYGSIIVIDVSKNEKPRIILEKSLYKTAVSKLCFDNTGTLLITTSEKDHLILLDARLSTKCNILGHTEISGSVKCISFKCISNDRDAWKVVLGVSHNQSKACKNLVVLEFDKNIFIDTISYYMDRTRLFKDISILKQTYQLTTSIYNICILSEMVIYALTNNGKKIAKFELSPFEVSSSNKIIETSEIYCNQTVSCSVISISSHGKWMLIAGADGYLTIREVEAMNNPAIKQVANYRNGGIVDAIYSVDGQNILMISNCNHIACLKWTYSTYGKSEAYFSIAAYQTFASTILDIATEENKFIESMNTISVSGKVTETCLEKTIKKIYAEENEKCSTTKTKLYQDINELRCQVLNLISNNDQVPDIYKLERQEFVLDTKEHDFVLQQRENKINELRAQIEVENIRKQYIRYLIKQECWDNMLVKGYSLKSFVSNVKVSNYPMIKRSDAELKKIEAVNFQRCLQNIENNIRKTFFESELISSPPLFDNLLENNNDADNNYFSTCGSLASLFTHNEFLLSQFSLATKVQKKEQIILLKDCVYKIKEKFNKQFNEMWNMKVQEIKRINERCTRMKKIIKDLDLNENTIEVGVDSDEEPDRIFDVRDNEISVNKYISKEERIKSEIKRKKDEEKSSTNNDNNRGHALDVMMGGRLEASYEMELNYDIQKPSFMEKPEIEWSDEECKLAKEYEKKKQTLQEERDKYKKILEAEFKKLQTLNQETSSNFDEKLQQLFQYKIKADMAVAQEELKMMRLAASISIGDEMEAKEHNLLNELIQLKEEKQLSSSFISKVQTELDTLRMSYESLVSEDKYLDKTFRKEFPELDQFTVDFLYKLFKKRPQVQRTLKAVIDNQISLTEENRFELRVPSSLAVNAVHHSVEDTLNGLDSLENKPEKILVETWSKLVTLRRGKFEKEQQLKSKALVLAQINTFLQKKKEYDNELKSRIEKTSENIQKIRDERLQFNLNIEVQLLLKQGQVEVGSCDLVPDYTECILVHRSVVENLNSTIKALGQTKLASMRESKDFRKGIHLLEWQLKEMLMQAEDLQTVAHDLQLLKVTKELQLYLSDTDQKLSKQQEIDTLENTLEMYKKIHQRSIKDKKRVVKALRQEIKEKVDANDCLKIDLQEIAVSVEERRNVNKGDDETVDKKEKEKKMIEIITRRKLVDLTRAQSLEINLLRSEAVNLRKSNFPILLNE